MNKLTIYYGVRNGGDGSAYPHLFESMELANWDQEHMTEGWGENCVGSFEFISESPITCIEEIITKEQVLCDYLADECEDDYDLYEFVKLFYNGVMPKITVEKGREFYSNIYINDTLIGEFWTYNTQPNELTQIINDTVKRLWGT